MICFISVSSAKNIISFGLQKFQKIVMLRTILRHQYRIPVTPVDRLCPLAHNREQHVVFVRSACVILDAKHVIDACHTVHEHVQQTKILSTDDPSSIRLKVKQNAHRTRCSALTVKLNQSFSRSWWRRRGTELSPCMDDRKVRKAIETHDSARSDGQRWKLHEAEVAQRLSTRSSTLDEFAMNRRHSSNSVPEASSLVFGGRGSFNRQGTWSHKF